MPETPDRQRNKPDVRRQTLRMYLLVALVAILPRLLVFHEWASSPFQYYYCLYGLDMRKLIVMSSLFVKGALGFTAGRGFLATVTAIAGRDWFIPAVVVAQMTMGVATALMTTHIYRRLFGGRLAAGMAGALCALYLPCIVYETHILKATLYLFLATLSLNLMLEAHRHGFRAPATFAAGIAIPGAFLVRIAGLPWLALAHLWLALNAKKKKRWGIAASAIAGTVVILGAVVAVNAARGLNSWYLVKKNYGYMFAAGAVSKMESLSVEPKRQRDKGSASPGVVKLAAGYALKAASIFMGISIPNNVNVAFERSKLTSLQFLLSPMLLVPLAAAGLTALALSGLATGKAAALFFHLTAFSATMIVFFPLERYRLVLTPVFCVAAVWWVGSFVRLLKTPIRPSDGSGLTDNVKLATPFLVFVVSLIASMAMGPIERSSDERAYGVAASIVPKALMAHGRFAEAEKILERHRSSSPDNAIININLASTLLGQRKIRDAKKILHSLEDINDPALEGRRCYELGEAALAEGAYTRAANYYIACLNLPIPETLQRLAMKRLDICHWKERHDDGRSRNNSKERP